MRIGGIVLCGGQSSRMGSPKALLPFGPELMLQRVVRLLGEVASPIVVVAAPDQELPPLPPDVLVARDEREGRGPLQGLHAGLLALAGLTVGWDQRLSGRAGPPRESEISDLRFEISNDGPALASSLVPPCVEAAYATSCDVPLLVPAFVRRLSDLLGEHEIAVPVEHDPEDEHRVFHHPLAALYRLSVVDRIAALLAADRLRPVFLFDDADTLRIHIDELRAVDPELQTLANLNHPADYLAALRAAGFHSR